MDRFFETGLGLIIMAVYGLLALGGLYWLWIAVEIGSFFMFVVGVFPLCYVVTAPVGAYSILFGVPNWVYAMFG